MAEHNDFLRRVQVKIQRVEQTAHAEGLLFQIAFEQLQNPLGALQVVCTAGVVVEAQEIPGGHGGAGRDGLIEGRFCPTDKRFVTFTSEEEASLRVVPELL